MANTTLRKGDKNEKVVELQNALINAGYDVGIYIFQHLRFK